jgi:hypothetical protein
MKTSVVTLACVLLLGIVGYGVWTAAMLARYAIARGGDYTIGLPNGYGLTRVYSDTVLLYGSTRQILIGPTVDGYQVQGRLIIGHARGTNDPNFPDAITGYFVVDTGTGKLQHWKDKESWLQALHRHGIFVTPDLQRPRRPR